MAATQTIVLDNLIYEVKYHQAGVIGHNAGSLPATIRVPERVDGFPVHYIGENAFQGCSDLREVILPASCTTIRQRGFANCNNLKLISYDNPNIHTAVYICEYAFDDCTSLAVFNAQYAQIQIGMHAFNRCVNLKKIIGNIRDIREKGFYHCNKLFEISIEHNATVSAQAFYKASINRIVFKGNLRRPSKLMMQSLSKTKIICTKQFPFLDYAYEGYDFLVGIQ